MSNTTTVAVVQASPVFNNLAASLEKAVELIKQAAARGAKLIAFGESWLSGYPAWLDYCPKAALWDYEPTKEVYALMRQNSLVIESKETELLASAARDNQATVVIGANERVDKGAGNGTLYNTLLTFDETGNLANHHRKLMPTFTERLVHGQGDGAGLKAVDTAAGRVGGLICWEHWMPLARQAMHNSGEQIHAALFPTVHETHQIASRHYAFEGRCFVLAAGLLMDKKDVPLEIEENLETSDTQFLLRGGSCIIAPNGKILVAPVFDEETIITAELDLNLIEKEKMTLDVSGHYQRPDIFKFAVERNTRSQSNIFE
jgi:nitrilase